MGLSRDPEGAVAVAGPIPVGESALSLRYRLPASTPDGEPLVFQREFRSPVDLLTVLIADTGIVPETERPHRRRPIRTEDRSYLHLEGFGIESGDRVAIALRRLPPGGSLPGLATTGFVLLAAIGSLFYLVAPLRERSEPAAAQEASGISPEREAIYAAIDDLDDDFETGKLSVEDHERMRAELRARAVAVLQAERDAEGRRGSAAASDRGDARCPRCDAIPSTQDRFCSQCGAPLRPGDSPAS
jgi:hypothetical protein